MDALYVFRHSVHGDPEIRNSFRSVANYAPNIPKVWILGDRPAFLSDETSLIEHVPHSYITRSGSFRRPVISFFLLRTVRVPSTRSQWDCPTNQGINESPAQIRVLTSRQCHVPSIRPPDIPLPEICLSPHIPSSSFSLPSHLPVLTDCAGRVLRQDSLRPVMGWGEFLSAVLGRLGWRVYCSARFWIEAFFDNRLQPQEARGTARASGSFRHLDDVRDDNRLGATPVVRRGWKRFVGSVVAERASQRFGADGEMGS
jgi:hypothetical protein